MKKIVHYLIITLAIGLLILLHIPIGKLPPIARFFDPFQGFWQNAESTPIQLPKQLALTGLQDVVTIDFDENLIPHIQASNDYDLYFAQGYITAYHRLWQMEFQTHAAAGRIAEIVGPTAIDFDQLQRRKGIVYAANNALKQVKKEKLAYDMLQAYAAGINAYISSLSYKHLPIEYKLLAYQPERWSPFKTALLSIQMADRLSGNDKSFEHTQVFHALGKEKFCFLFPEYHGQESIIPKNTPWNIKPIPIQPASSITPPLVNQVNTAQTNPSNGSNNWAIAGKKTKHGYPYLANDPHLNLQLPALWYAIHLKSPDLHTAGFSLPGTPGILIGFNENIAWGMTNAAWTVRDWYTIDFTDETRTEYHYDNLLLKTQFVTEAIKVKGNKTVYDTVLYTHLGPIVYDENFSAGNKAYHNLAMHWIGHQPGQEVYAAYLLNRAKDLKEFEQALHYYHVPAQNFAFASKQNDIALKIAGEFPARFPGQGRFIMPGNTSAYAWQAFIPKHHHPKLINPQLGYVSSANERATDKGYPYYYHQYYEEYYRNRRIRQVLSELKKVDEKAMMRLQNDNHNLAAQENLPWLLQHIDISQLNDTQKKAYDTLVAWNLQNEAKQTAPAIFKAWQKQLIKLFWQSFHDASLLVTHPSFYYTIAVLKKQIRNAHFPLSDYSSLQELIRDSFKQAIQALVDWEQTHQQTYQWGNYRETTIPHLARIAPFAVQHLKVNGGEEIVNANNGSHGVSFRLVVSLEQTPKAWLIYPGGQPGNPGNPCYTQFIDAWCKGDYISLSLDGPKEKTTDCQLVLKPLAPSNQ